MRRPDKPPRNVKGRKVRTGTVPVPMDWTMIAMVSQIRRILLASGVTST
jgi:hypothetical protein